MQGLPIQFYKVPNDYKTRVRSRRGFEYVNHIDGWDRLDKNRRRADWYFERVVNDCMSAWEHSEAFKRLGLFVEKAHKVCQCLDSQTCRCLERLFLRHVLSFLQSCKGTYLKIPHVHLVRAWFVAEYGIKSYDRNNLHIIEEWDSFELEDEYGNTTKECV